MSEIHAGQIRKFFELLSQKGLSREGFQQRLENGTFADFLDPSADLSDRNAFRAALKLSAAMPEQIMLSVDYNRSLEQMIVAGHYDWKNDDITVKRFSLKGEGIEQFEAKVFHFDRNISSEAVVEAIKAAGWEVGKIEHLLAFGEKYPEEQRKYPIVALGSVAGVYGGRYVPCLDRGGAERRLGLGWWGGGWRGYCRFLAVRKLSSGS